MPFPGACIRPMVVLSDDQHSPAFREIKSAQILRKRVCLDIEEILHLDLEIVAPAGMCVFGGWSRVTEWLVETV